MTNHISHKRIKQGIKPDTKRILRLAPFYFIPLTLLSVGLVIGIYRFLINQDINILKSEEKVKVGINKELISVETETIISDLFHLKNGHEFTQFIETNDPIHRSRLSNELVQFSQYKKIYDQVRYIDETGQEILKIKNQHGVSYIIHNSNLQNKSHLYYFEEAMNIPNNGFFVSSFDLNTENGIIETPYNPTIRFCTPIQNKAGQKKGIIVLNYKGNVLLNRMASALIGAENSFWLLNKQGYWLYSKNPDINWGFMFENKKVHAVKNKYPKEWAIISNQKQGQILTEKGLFTFNKVYPIADSIHRLAADRIKAGSSGNYFSHNQYHWIIVSHISPLNLGQRTTQLQWVTMALSLLLTIACAIIVWFYVRSKIIDELSSAITEDVARLNESLIVTSSVISGNMDQATTLKEALKSARRLSEARYGALALTDEGEITDLFFDGLSDDEEKCLGQTISNNGLFKSIITTKNPVRIEDIPKHPNSCGFSDEHPNMKTLLGVPIVYKEDILGGLYLTEKSNGRVFTKQDEIIVVKLADHIGAVIKKAALYEEIRLGASIFNNSIEGITITDTNGTIIKVNNAFTTITGYSAKEVVGRNPRLLKSNRHDQSFYKAMWHSIHHTDKWEGEIWNRRKNGETYPEWLSISAIKNFAGQTEHYVAVFHDISEVKKTQEKLKYQAYHDVLTGLPNRQLFNDRLNKALARAKRHNIHLGILFLDLDNFKRINDTLGHRYGDLLLQNVAKHLSDCCRDEDTVARLGGDEFIILMSELINPVQDTAIVAQRIIENIKSPFQLADNEVTTQASIGIAIFPDDGETAEDLVKYADMAMYKAKNEGKNQFALFTDDMNKKLLKRVSMEKDLRQALQRDEFELYYQPKINIDTGRLSGAEALIRWNRNKSDLVPPDEFIPLAEETGLIIEIGTWVLYEACEQVKKWQNKGFKDFTIAVNLSPKQLRNERIIQTTKEALNDTKLPPRSLTLEITESIMLFDVESTIAMMECISRIGVHWSMDDFGTGYSSIRYLQRLPLNEMKIDKSFIRDIPKNEANSKIIISTVALAHSFGLKVVAEGVEDYQHLKFLSACRCNEAQGYLFSKPLAANDFEKFLDINGMTNWNDDIARTIGLVI